MNIMIRGIELFCISANNGGTVCSHRNANRLPKKLSTEPYIYIRDLNPIRPVEGGSEARMTKVTAANQKPLTL